MFQQAAAFLKHKQVHITYQVLPFQYADEPGGHDDSLLRMIIPYQCLCPGTRTGLQIQLWLQYHPELPAFDAVEQAFD